jgi:hypothetical protein
VNDPATIIEVAAAVIRDQAGRYLIARRRRERRWRPAWSAK